MYNIRDDRREEEDLNITPQIKLQIKHISIERV